MCSTMCSPLSPPLVSVCVQARPGSAPRLVVLAGGRVLVPVLVLLGFVIVEYFFNDHCLLLLLLRGCRFRPGRRLHARMIVQLLLLLLLRRG